MHRSMWHCTGGSDQSHPKEMQEGKLGVWRGFTNSWGKKRNKGQGRKGKIYPTECRVSENEQCKEIEENNGMRKTGDLIKKTGFIKGTFHARMDMIKDRNSKDLAEAKEIKKRWQEYTEELCKKGLNVPRNHNGMVTHLEPDILECRSSGPWEALLKRESGSDAIPAELFKTLKEDDVKVLHSICQQIWKTQ